MKVYAVFLPMKDPELSQTHRQAHLDYLARRREEKRIFANGRFADGAGGLVIYFAESEEDARELALQDPYVVHQARGYEIHEWDMVTQAVLPWQA